MVKTEIRPDSELGRPKTEFHLTDGHKIISTNWL
jgi:hypothetical protein